MGSGERNGNCCGFESETAICLVAMVPKKSRLAQLLQHRRTTRQPSLQEKLARAANWLAYVLDSIVVQVTKLAVCDQEIHH
jgi:hypothetical protein